MEGAPADALVLPLYAGGAGNAGRETGTLLYGKTALLLRMPATLWPEDGACAEGDSVHAPALANGVKEEEEAAGAEGGGVRLVFADKGGFARRAAMEVSAALKGRGKADAGVLLVEEGEKFWISHEGDGVSLVTVRAVSCFLVVKGGAPFGVCFVRCFARQKSTK